MSEFVRMVRQPQKPIASRLLRLDLELTERCNNNCVHCCINRPATDLSVRSRELVTSRWLKVLTEAADLGCIQVRFTGGEPLLRDDFEELYLHARGLGMKVLVFTNGRLVSERLAGLFSRIPPLEPIEISVYGMSAASYEAVSRVPGSFAEFRRGVDRLLEHRIPFVVKTVNLPQNRHELEVFAAWARTIPGMGRPTGFTTLLELRSRRDDPARNARIASLRIAPEEIAAHPAEGEASDGEHGCETASGVPAQPGNARHPADRLFGCAPGRSLCVDAYGRAQPCLSMRAPELTRDLDSGLAGSAATGSSAGALAETLDWFASLQKLRSTNAEYLRRCAVCRLRPLCEQCPARSWSEHGVLDRPVEYLCGHAHARARSLGWIREGERGWEVAENFGEFR